MNDSVLLPNGFRTSGLHCGVKADATRLDLALFVSDAPCTAAGVFTQNRVCGAPVTVSRERVPRGTARGVVINSGNANACTGARGIEDARWMTALTAEHLRCSADDVLVCSTGVIGRFLPKEKLAAGIPQAVAQLADSPEAFTNAARGMMTTDTFHKQSTREVSLGGATIRVSGASKGAAMIGPNMATMLAVVMTDAALSPAEADRMLRHAVDRSFNCISVEGHTSTSDTVILLANGAAGPKQFEPGALAEVARAIDDVCMELGQAIIRDAEGAGHFVTIDVRGLRTRDEARRIAKEIAESALVKTAIAGADPNWGRIVSAAGYSGVTIDEPNMTLRLNGILLYEWGTPVAFDAKAASQSIRENRETHIDLECNLGDASVRFWTCDLTAEYVRLNADYTT